MVDAAIEVAEHTGPWLFDLPLIAPIRGMAMFEFTVREAVLDVSAQQAVRAISIVT